MSTELTSTIKRIDVQSVHKITSGQVVIDLQTAVKELVENSIDAGATNIEVRFKEYGLKCIEVVDNGCGIAPDDYSSIARKHHTSKLTTFSDLTTILTYGFRGEALSSLCALSEEVSVATCTANGGGLGNRIEFDREGVVKNVANIAKQRGTTVTVSNLFKPLPVRRKEFERNAKREFGKTLGILIAYSLVPCLGGSKHPDTEPNKVAKSGVRFAVSNQLEGGRKTIHITTPPVTSLRSSVSALWGSKSLDSIVDLDVAFSFSRLERGCSPSKKSCVGADDSETEVKVKGLVSKFECGCGRTGTDRQFFYVNGRPWAGSKIQKVFNEVYHSFNANQMPFIVADVLIPTAACDINVSPDKRTIFLHGEGNFLQALKVSLEEAFAPSRSMYDVAGVQSTSHKKRTTSSESREGNKKRTMSETDEREQGQGEDMHVGSGGGPDNIEPTSTPASSSQPPTIVSIAGSSSRSDTSPGHAAEYTPPTSPRPGVNDAAAMHVENENIVLGDSETPANPARPYSPPPTRKWKDPTKRRYIQTILDTTGAAWSRKVSLSSHGYRGGDGERRGEGEPPRKKLCTESGDVMSSDDEELDGRSVEDGKGKGKEVRMSAIEENSLERLKARLKLIGSAGRSSDEDIGVGNGLRGRGVADGAASEGVYSRRKPDVSETLDASSSLAKGSRTRLAQDLEPEGENMEIDEPAASIMVEESDVDGVTSPVKSNQVIDISDEVMADDTLLENGTTDITYDEFVSRPEVVRTTALGHVLLRFDISRISDIWRRLRERLPSASDDVAEADGGIGEGKVPAEAGVSNVEDDSKAVDALSRVIEKADFEKMEVVGQFNLGFIVARRRKMGCASGAEGPGMMDDLFIVDQHAADEKYNFETLQQTTMIRSQKLLRPQPLELTATDELVAVENIETLRQNGFEVEVADEDDPMSEKAHRLSLTAQPVSKSTVFDMKDLEELIHLMQDRPTGQMVRCSKARAMFAMRACRKSVMVGKPLNRAQMSAVVRNMGKLDQPWNCPHGRPTMRHLSDVTLAAKNCSRDLKRIDWTAFGALAD